MPTGTVLGLAAGLLRKLSGTREHSYRSSNALESIDLPAPELLQPLAAHIADALQSGCRSSTQQACQGLVEGICSQLGVSAPRVRIAGRRPASRRSETHGLYEFGTGGAPGTITVWMHTARQARVVAFRTFLRTLLHELCHHLDFRLLGLRHTFHTAGFYRREGSLMRQLAP